MKRKVCVRMLVGFTRFAELERVVDGFQQKVMKMC